MTYAVAFQAWLPFNFRMDGYNEKGEATNHSRISVDASVGYLANFLCHDYMSRKQFDDLVHRYLLIVVLHLRLNSVVGQLLNF